MKAKENEKVRKCLPLLSDMRQLYPGISVEVVPLVIGHTGVVAPKSKESRMYIVPSRVAFCR